MAGGALLNALAAAQGGHGRGRRDRLRRAAEGRASKTRYIGTKKTRGRPARPETGQGPSFESQVHAVQLAEVEVDIETGDVRVLQHDHRRRRRARSSTPRTSRASSRAAWTWASGYALREQYVAGETKDWVTFGYPTMRTAFDMDVIIRETPRKYGTKGAVGVGEMTMVPDRAGGHQRHLRRHRRVDLATCRRPRTRSRRRWRRDGAVRRRARVRAAARAGEFGLSRRYRRDRRPPGPVRHRGLPLARRRLERGRSGGSCRRGGLAALDETHWRVIHFLRAVLPRERPRRRSIGSWPQGTGMSLARTRGPLPRRASSTAPGAWPACPTRRAACEPTNMD